MRWIWSLINNILFIVFLPASSVGKNSPFLKSAIISSSLILKIRHSRSGRLLAESPPYASRWLLSSTQLGLAVTVIKRWGFPYQRHIAIASWYFSDMYRGPAVKDEGRMIFLPTCVASASPVSTASHTLLYRSARSFFWFRLKNSGKTSRP